MKSVLIILLFISHLGICQITDDQFKIYSNALDRVLRPDEDYQIDSVIVVEQYDNEFIPRIEVVKNPTNEPSIAAVFQELLIATYSDTTFLRRFMKEEKIRVTLNKLLENFDSHPVFTDEDFDDEKAFVNVITRKKYESFRGTNYRSIQRGWKKIQKKYSTRYIMQFSRITQHKNLAAFYYSCLCGGLCGSGNIMIVENQNGKWTVIGEINFWMV